MKQQQVRTNTTPGSLDRQTRFYHLDGIKILLSILVVMHHSALAYTIHQDWPIRETFLTDSLTPFLAINASFFMGAFFFISGFLVPRSFAKSNFQSFIASKARRLLIPALLLALLVKPFLRIALGQDISFMLILDDYLYHFDFAHGWFLIQLFFYCLIYGVFRNILTRVQLPFEKASLYFFMILGLGGITALISSIFPINTWFFCHTIEPYHFPQYILLFFLGTFYVQHGNPLKLRIIRLSLITSLCLIGIYIANYTFHILPYAFEHFWASALSITITFGLFGLFERYGHQQSKWKRILGNATFGVYLVHNFIVFLVGKALLGLNFGPLEKFWMTSALSLVLSFLCVIGAQNIRAHLQSRI
ncbi:MAG: acyltransferase family protein [Candidatus Nucleicultricaceae bacterium]|jgi:hypothetical protein